MKDICSSRAQKKYSLVAIGQHGRLQYEALILAASLRLSEPSPPELLICEPQPGPLWGSHDPRIEPAIKNMLISLGAKIIPFENTTFGKNYAYGNKIEALLTLPERPFLFLDTDTLILGPLNSIHFNFSRPSASMRRQATWPKIFPYGPGYHEIWKSLYDLFGLNFSKSLLTDRHETDWQRYLYFNAGWFFYESPSRFGQRFLEYATQIRDTPPKQLAAQNLHPWLDQIALPLTIHSFNGVRPGPELSGLDGDITCHWRRLSLLYAREKNQTIALLERIAYNRDLRPFFEKYAPMEEMVYRQKGAQGRALFDQQALPFDEKDVRMRLKQHHLWPDERS